MKKISTLFFILLSISAFSQSEQILNSLQNKAAYYPQPLNAHPSKNYPVSLPKMSAAPSTAGHGDSRAGQNISFYMDYGAMDSLSTVWGPFTGSSFYHDDMYSFVSMNGSLSPDSLYYGRWAAEWFPTIVDFVDNGNWPYNTYAPDKIQMNIDTVYVRIGHIHLSGANNFDTIRISIWDLDSFQSFGTGFDSGVSATGALQGSATWIVDSSLIGGTGTAPDGGFYYGLYPFSMGSPVAITKGHRFIIQVDFHGPSSDLLVLSSARRNDCNSPCGASWPYINLSFNQLVDTFNSAYGIRLPVEVAAGPPPTIDTLFLPSTALSILGCNDACERVYAQDFDIYPNIKAVISQFFVTASASTQSAVCPQTNINITANGGGSSATPYVYSWTTSGGYLSSSTGQQVTLTTSSTTTNDTVIVTLTDANHVSVEDTVIINSGGIAVKITNPTQPIELTCGTKAVITTSISGSTLGRNYIWSNGVEGLSQSTITDSVAGTIRVTVTNSQGCSDTASVVVEYTGTQNQVSFKLPRQIGENQYENCPLIFTNTSSSYAAPWVATFDPLGDNSNDVVVYTGNPDIPFTYSKPGVFQATLTMDSAGCSFSSTQTVQITTVPNGQSCTSAVQDLTFSNNISLMPNPTSGYLHINVLGVQNNISVKIYNILGAEIKTFQANEIPTGVYSKDFDLTALPSGTYLVRIDSGDQTAVKKLEISR